ncbi:hypothetical protein PMAYCL1PPCAC_22171 [Pristionchus mayeri]|uniref:Uncharacterized protein n=1 Tax=Pristionchus mayeri TaxID=1317129 RepID=A0AAN5I647_9BILA|nr:hypothetical protein PMAYCL1PPCAC_22171 [Pristionchus mayeri]
MKSLILLAALLTVVASYCSIINGVVTESGYPPRPLTNGEKSQLKAYEQQWNQWGAQFARYMQGKASMPTAPVMPCFCHSCT